VLNVADVFHSVLYMPIPAKVKAFTKVSDIRVIDQIHASLSVASKPSNIHMCIDDSCSRAAMECGKYGLEDLGGVEVETRRSQLPGFRRHVASIPSFSHLQYIPTCHDFILKVAYHQAEDA
jgi:hypothetical protein